MCRGVVRGLVGLAVISATAGASLAAEPPGAAPAADPAPDRAAFRTTVAPFIKAHCAKCHGAPRQKDQKGRTGKKDQVRLDDLDGDLIHGKDRKTWSDVAERLAAGEMPPKSEARPPASGVRQVLDWIARETKKAENQQASGPSPAVGLRRLNRAEYANTLADLLHVRFPFGDGPLDVLPPDGSAHGFDKVGSALTIDPSLLGQYVTMARRVADAAIVSGPPPVPSRRRRFELEETARSDAIGYQCREPHVVCRPHDVVLMDKSLRTWDYLRLDPTKALSVPANGEYTLRVRMSADLGARGEPLVVQLLWPGETVIAEWTLTREDTRPRIFEVTLPIKTAGKDLDGPSIQLVNGTSFFLFNHRALAFQGEADRASAAGELEKAQKLLGLAKAEGAASPERPNPAARDRTRLPKLMIDWIELEGPHVGAWPPLSHREVFFEGPSAVKDLAYARRIFQRLLFRAYRRPVTPTDVDAATREVERELAAGETFEEAMKVGLAYVLASPKFLYLVESSVTGAPRALDDFELASRLSYFLWSSMPDGELFDLASAHRLRAPGVLEAQVRRMLRDDRARGLVEGFAGSWLQASKFAGIQPNRQIYPEWDGALEAAVKREPLAFFAEVVRGDLSILNFLDSDFAMLNERLARHYGIPGVAGPQLRRVALPADSHRGGLLGQAGILSIGSDGTRTLPVRRAAWVLDALYDSPPPPPPPNVREVEPNLDGRQLTVRQRLLAHQKVESCAACHRKIDAYGLGLESYDAVGAWRTRQNGEEFGPAGDKAPPIDSSGTLPDGRSFRTTAELRALVRADRARFCRAFARKMLTYALGRAVEPSDARTLDALEAALREHDYRISALVTAIVESAPFGSK